MFRSQNLAVLLLVAFLASPADAACIVGPDQMPARLTGEWKVSLCESSSHNWIRYENTETGEVHTAGRYAKGFGGIKKSWTCRQSWPKAPVSGVIWDIDLKHEAEVRQGVYVLRSCYVSDPVVYRGTNCGHGHCCLRRNCTTHARDAWCFYSGEYYRLGMIHSPGALRRQICSAGCRCR